MIFKKCTQCGQSRPATDVYFKFDKRFNRLNPRCRICENKNLRDVRANKKKLGLCTTYGCQLRSLKNKTLCRHHETENKLRGVKNRNKLKLEVFNAYGGPICKCCGEVHIEFLTLDHIKGNGNKHRLQIGNKGGHSMYCWIKKNNFPKGFRILCMNCNLSLGAYGYCPHNK